MQIKILLTTIAISIVMCFILFILISWLFAKWWCKPRKILSDRLPDTFQLPFEEISFTSYGIRLNGWLIPAPYKRDQQSMVIITHGWSGNAANMLKIAKVLNKSNHNVFMFDFRGHGASEEDGPITIRKFAEDIIASIDYLVTRTDLDMKQFVVLGHSMGASGAILAASMDRRIRALISCSAFSSPFDITITAMKKLHLNFWPLPFLVFLFIERWINTSMKNASPKNQIVKINVPILLIHGSEDTYVSPKNLEDLYKNANPEYRNRLLVKGRNHYDIRNDPVFHNSILSFLNNISVETVKS